MTGSAASEKALILPPNKQLEPNFEFSKIPVIYDNLFFLDFNENGNCIFGSSNVTGTFWEGTLMYFKDAQHMVDFNFSQYYIYMTASDGKFVNYNTIALAEDTGVLNVLGLDEEGSCIQPMNYFRHSKIIPQISVWSKSSKVLSCSGRSVTIWDINSIERKPVFLSENVHIADINSVEALKHDTNLFFTAASDRKACLWDARTAQTPTVIYTDGFCSLTRLAVNPSDSNYVVIGTQAGNIYLIDTREPNEFVCVSHCFEANVNNIEFNNLNKFAVCGDTNKILVFDCDKGLAVKLYENCNHSGHVKGIKWHGDMLYSCGFGRKQMLKHVMSKSHS